MRITRKMLANRVERLNVILNRPASAWTRSTDANGKVTMRANEGHFLLSTYSPGDGWTRYTLAQVVGEHGGEMTVSPGCTAQEMHTYLRGVFDVLDSQFMCDGGKHTFDKLKKQTLAPLSPVTYDEDLIKRCPTCDKPLAWTAKNGYRHPVSPTCKTTDDELNS